MEAHAELRTLRIVSAGMIAGVLLFLPVVLFVRPGMLENATGSLDLLAGLAAGAALLSLPLASALRAARWPGTTPDQDKEYWPRRRAAHVVSMGILEGAAFFCCTALLVGKPWWPLFAMLVPLGGMLAWFPRDE